MNISPGRWRCRSASPPPRGRGSWCPAPLLTAWRHPPPHLHRTPWSPCGPRTEAYWSPLPSSGQQMYTKKCGKRQSLAVNQLLFTPHYCCFIRKSRPHVIIVQNASHHLGVLSTLFFVISGQKIFFLMQIAISKSDAKRSLLTIGKKVGIEIESVKCQLAKKKKRLSIDSTFCEQK